MPRAAREGLARYIAELDLDPTCTSYLWDGAPGAWDGIDAWNLEAGPDTTAVAFPTLISGLQPCPTILPRTWRDRRPNRQRFGTPVRLDR